MLVPNHGCRGNRKAIETQLQMNNGKMVGNPTLAKNGRYRCTVCGEAIR